MTYEDLLALAEKEGLIVKEMPLQSSDGRIKGNRIAIRDDISTQTEKSCVLAEEIGHFKTTCGDIIRIGSIPDVKQENRARIYAYNLKIGLIGIVRAYEHGCRTIDETAKYLDVTEEFLRKAIECYKSKYGLFAEIDNYVIYFFPGIAVYKKVDDKSGL